MTFQRSPCVIAFHARNQVASSAPARHSPAASHGRRQRARASKRRSARTRREWLGWHTCRAGGDVSRLGKYVVTAIGNLAQLLDGFVQVAAVVPRLTDS